jgi:hypothetical protein
MGEITKTAREVEKGGKGLLQPYENWHSHTVKWVRELEQAEVKLVINRFTCRHVFLFKYF